MMSKLGKGSGGVGICLVGLVSCPIVIMGFRIVMSRLICRMIDQDIRLFGHNKVRQ